MCPVVRCCDRYGNMQELMEVEPVLPDRFARACVQQPVRRMGFTIWCAALWGSLAVQLHEIASVIRADFDSSGKPAPTQ